MIQRGTRTAARLARADFDSLLAVALEAQANAYAPYSGYHVGAAVVDGRGEVTPGCNVESASYGATICAERAAIAGAVTAGATRLVACVVVTPDAEPASCCGICRQVLAEFGPDILVFNAAAASDIVVWGTSGDWLPGSFRLDRP